MIVDYNPQLVDTQPTAEIIQICKDHTGLDPQGELNSTEELILLDCYWYNMGFYDKKHRQVRPPTGWPK